eukprot:1184035-Prorocentrum_minimum.AAC.8
MSTFRSSGDCLNKGGGGSRSQGQVRVGGPDPPRGRGSIRSPGPGGPDPQAGRSEVRGGGPSDGVTATGRQPPT